MVELPLGLSALPKLVVVVIKALPVRAELFQAALVDVVDAALTPILSVPVPIPYRHNTQSWKGFHRFFGV